MNIAPYLQIIHIKNHPLQSWLIMHIYMPSHNEDLRLICIIQQTIEEQIIAHPNHTYILGGDFNRDIALIGRQNENGNTPLQEEDILWRTSIENQTFTYIPTNTNYSRQGGHNYTSTNLIDGFFIKTKNPTLYTSTTITEQNLNFDHLPITLHILPNTLLAHQPTNTPNQTTRVMNPIPQENLEKFNTKFFEENGIQLNNLSTLLSIEQLNQEQW